MERKSITESHVTGSDVTGYHGNQPKVTLPEVAWRLPFWGVLVRKRARNRK